MGSRVSRFTSASVVCRIVSKLASFACEQWKTQKYENGNNVSHCRYRTCIFKWRRNKQYCSSSWPACRGKFATFILGPNNTNSWSLFTASRMSLSIFSANFPHEAPPSSHITINVHSDARSRSTSAKPSNIKGPSPAEKFARTWPLSHETYLFLLGNSAAHVHTLIIFFCIIIFTASLLYYVSFFSTDPYLYCRRSALLFCEKLRVIIAWAL